MSSRTFAVIVVLMTVSVAGPAFAMPPAGELDETFGTGGRVDGAVCLGSVLQVQPDGKILVGGRSLAEPPGTSPPCIARHLADGSLDASFGAGGITVLPGSPDVEDLRLDSTGAIIVETWKSPVGDSLLRLLPDGSFDASFGVGGTVPLDDVNAKFVLQADDKIITLHGEGGSNDLILIRRHLADGSALDPSFGSLGEVSLANLGLVATNSYVDAAIRSDGKIIVAGTGGLARLDASGALDGSFGTGGIAAASNTSVADVVVQPDDGILVRNYGLSMARFTANGALDTSFGVAGYVSHVSEISAIQSDGRIIIVRSDNGFNAGSFAALIERLLPSGGLDLSFGAGGVTQIPTFKRHHAAFLPDGRIVAGSDGRLVVIYAGTCGDGTQDVGEDCDDGNVAAGDGCGATCCVADADGDGRCDAYDPCTAPVPVVKVRCKLPAANIFAQPFVVKGWVTMPAPIDPLATGMRLIVRSATRKVVDASILPITGWTASGASWHWEGLEYPAGVEPVRVERIAIRSLSTGVVKMKLRGNGPLYLLGLVELPLSYEVSFDPGMAANGQCAEATFPGPPPLPSCAPKGTGGAFCG